MSDEKHEPVSLSTYGDLNRGGYRLDAYCPKCGRHKKLDLSTLPPDKPYMTTRIICSVCGSRAEIRLGGGSKLTGLSRPA